MALIELNPSGQPLASDRPPPLSKVRNKFIFLIMSTTSTASAGGGENFSLPMQAETEGLYQK